jgi:hypothetical protein
MRELLDRLIPSHLVTRRPRAADPWFDSQSLAVKCHTRKLERAYSTSHKAAFTRANMFAVVYARVRATSNMFDAHVRAFKHVETFGVQITVV